MQASVAVIMVWLSLMISLDTLFFLEDKTCTKDIFKSFAKKAQNEYDVQIKHVGSDNGDDLKILILLNSSMNMVLLMSSLLHTLPKKWSCWTKEQNSHWNGKNYAQWV